MIFVNICRYDFVLECMHESRFVFVQSYWILNYGFKSLSVTPCTSWLIIFPDLWIWNIIVSHHIDMRWINWRVLWRCIFLKNSKLLNKWTESSQNWVQAVGYNRYATIPCSSCGHFLPDKGRAFKLDFIIKSSSYHIILFAHTHTTRLAKLSTVGEISYNTKPKYIATITGIMWSVQLATLI